MKKILYTGLFLCSLAATSAAQTVSKEQLKQEIEAFRNEVFQAATVFLNANNPVETRINAIARYPFLYDDAQIAQARALVFDGQQSPLIRATALNKIVNQVPEDDELGTSVINWMQNAATPKELRDEALNTLKTLSFSGFAMYTKRQQLMAALRNVTRDPDIEYRRFAFNYLLAHGDSFAQGLLTEQLDKNQTNLLPTAEAIRVLALNPHGDYLPSVYRVFQNPKSEEILVESMAVLGSYPLAKNKIIGLLKDKKQSKQVRSVALGTLNANYPAEFSTLVQSMLSDSRELDDLKIAAIMMEMYRRQSNQEKSKRKTEDQFDKSVRSLAISTKSADLKKVSSAYLEAIWPK